MADVLQIDIKQIVAAKTNGRHVPNIFIRFLEHIAHVEEINGFLSENPNIRDFDFIRAVIRFLQCDADFEGLHNIPDNEEPLVFVSNHPLGGLDGMILASTLAEKRDRQLKIIVNDLLMNLKPMQNLLVPVNKTGGQTHQYALKQQELWSSNNDILTFPAGACSRKQGNKIEDLKWHKAFIANALKHNRPIVPIYFEGKNSNFFYNLANWRKRLHIRTNIEMLFLADEMFKARGKTFNVFVGKPIFPSQLDNSKTPLQWAQVIRDITYNLPKLCKK